MDELQQTLVELINTTYTDGLTAIGNPTLDDQDRIVVDFADGDRVFTATIDVDGGTITY
jgi:hypothetical protein